ncbi:MAG: FAD binding domain-containing protein [Holdemanella sp.]|nr:FAD binding domain-containing protein [Holdemanella sp.]
MLEIKNYIRVKSIEEAYELNQKKNNTIIGGMLWLKMQDRTIGTAIDLSDLGLDKIVEEDDKFIIGAMVTLRDLELHEGLNALTQKAMKESVRHIVGVQFRNLATVGGSIFGRYGFSDVLTVFLSMNAKVQTYEKGIISLKEFSESKYDNDIVMNIIVDKKDMRIVYQSIRNNNHTDFPALTCSVGYIDGKYYVACGARPYKAKLVICDDLKGVSSQFDTATNNRASAQYRAKMMDVLINRAYKKMKGE